MASHARDARAMSEFQRAKKLLAEAAHCDPAMIPDDVRIGQFERWDSLAHLRLVLGIEAQIGRQLDPDETVRIETLADITTLLTPAR
jgi:acyl carrier protein